MITVQRQGNMRTQEIRLSNALVSAKVKGKEKAVLLTQVTNGQNPFGWGAMLRLWALAD